VRQARLLDPPQTLKVGVLYQVENNTVGNPNEAIDRVVEDFVISHEVSF
jgi:hypothetical protein